MPRERDPNQQIGRRKLIIRSAQAVGVTSATLKALDFWFNVFPSHFGNRARARKEFPQDTIQQEQRFRHLNSSNKDSALRDGVVVVGGLSVAGAATAVDVFSAPHPEEVHTIKDLGPVPDHWLAKETD